MARQIAVIIAACLLGLTWPGQHAVGEDGKTSPAGHSDHSTTADHIPNLQVFKLPPEFVTYQVSDSKSKSMRFRFVRIHYGNAETLAQWDIDESPFVGKITIFTEHEGALPPEFSRCPMSWLTIGIQPNLILRWNTNGEIENTTSIRPTIQKTNYVKLMDEYRGMKNAVRVTFYSGLGGALEIEGMHTGIQSPFGRLGQAKRVGSPDEKELLIAAWSGNRKLKPATMKDLIEHSKTARSAVCWALIGQWETEPKSAETPQ